MISRIKYYLSSIPTLLGQVTNWYELVKLPLTRQPVVLRLKNGLRLKVRSVMDVWIVKEACLDRIYEKYGTVMKDTWTVIDIGAGLGDFAVLTAHEHPTNRVYAFEPFPESFKLLNENITLNGVTNVMPLLIAVGSQSGKATLATTGQAVQHTTTDSQVSGNATSSLEVQALSLDDVFTTNHLALCEFIKIDCEGSEFDILFNASRETLGKIRHVCLEYHDGFTQYTHKDLIRYLEENGFSVQTTPNPVHNYLGYLYAHR
jgi:FkbM family methyltransferase